MVGAPRRSAPAFGSERFVGRHARLEGRVHDHRNPGVGEVLVHQRLHIDPVESAHAGGEARQGDAGDLLVVDLGTQRLQGMTDVLQTGLARFAAVVAFGAFLGEQIDDAAAVGAGPSP